MSSTTVAPRRVPDLRRFGGALTRGVLVRRAQASSGEEEAYKPGAESDSEDFDAEASDSDGAPRKAPRKKAAKKPKTDADAGEGAAGAEPLSKADKLAAKKRAAKEAARAEIAEGMPTLACRLAGVAPEAWLAALASFADNPVKKLTALLKHNALASSGAKMEQAARCAEATLLGCLPACPRCRAARLKWDEEGSKISGDLTVSCPGHYSDDRAAYFACNFVAAASKVKRAPWRSLDEAAAADAAGGDAAAAAAAQPELIDDATAARIAALPEPRAAVDAVLAEVTRLKLSVPATANPRTEIGAAMLAHRDGLTGAWNARKVLAVLAEKYPPKVGAEGGEEGAAGGGDSSCRVAANDGLADAFIALASAADDHWCVRGMDVAARVRLC